MVEPSYPIETERLLLRPLTAADLDDLMALHSREDVARYLYLEAGDTAAIRDSFESKLGDTSLEDEGERLSLAAVRREGGPVIGEVTLWWRSRKHASGEVGFVFHPDHGGSGLATEAAAVMLDIGFRDVGLHRIIGRCDARNEPSARLMERLGMRCEARLLENEWVKGEWTDELSYAILDREWNGLRPPRAPDGA